jgi:acyl-CoA carboxylase epsilon subunit
MSDETTEEPAPARPLLRVVSGLPTPEELAVVTALVAAASGGEDEPAPRVRRGSWSDPAAQFRRPLVPGPNGWRAGLR